jgi:hypothetical protein
VNKYIKLVICIVVDLIGMGSFALPLIGEVSDVFWAPISSVLLYLLFGGKEGAIGSLINFTEEALPGADFIPTLTLTWLYVYLKKDKKEEIS